VSLSNRTSATKIELEIGSKNCIAVDSKIDRQNCVAADSKIRRRMPINSKRGKRGFNQKENAYQKSEGECLSILRLQKKN
jgi:hypothetical protein